MKPTLLASPQATGYNQDMPRHKSISEQLRQAIMTAPESRYRIARGSGVSEGQLSRFVRGESGLTLDTVDVLAEYLELEVVRRPKRRR